jgi:hypothetical protein
MSFTQGVVAQLARAAIACKTIEVQERSSDMHIYLHELSLKLHAK